MPFIPFTWKWKISLLLDMGMDFPSDLDGKESACIAGDPGLIPSLGRSLEKEIATESSTLTWRIPWTEEPGKLQSMESQKVRLY